MLAEKFSIHFWARANEGTLGQDIGLKIAQTKPLENWIIQSTSTRLKLNGKIQFINEMVNYSKHV